MTDKFDLAKKLLVSGDVRRWHTIRDLHQTTAEHSWGVAVIISLCHPNPSADLLRAALLHDCHEKMFGDIPSPIKDRWPEIKAAEEHAEVLFFHDLGLVSPYDHLSASDLAWLDWADKIEAYYFLLGRAGQEVYDMRVKYVKLIDDAWDEVLKFPMIGKPWVEWKDNR
jgi:5'-deoxynucleotidase YfbR-like HD superfamily hydrolase